jgi:hypothetical protein
MTATAGARFELRFGSVSYPPSAFPPSGVTAQPIRHLIRE